MGILMFSYDYLLYEDSIIFKNGELVNIHNYDLVQLEDMLNCASVKLRLPFINSDSLCKLIEFKELIHKEIDSRKDTAFTEEDLEFLENLFQSIEDSFGWGEFSANRWLEILNKLRKII